MGCALWAVGTGAGHSRDDGHRKVAAMLFERGIAPVAAFSSPRSWTFTLIGIHEYLRRYPLTDHLSSVRMELTARLLDGFHACALEDWPWFEESLTYENAALLSGVDPQRPVDAASRSLRDWPEILALVGLPANHAVALLPADRKQRILPAWRKPGRTSISSRSRLKRWSPRVWRRIAPPGMPFWRNEAKRAFEWFLGRNASRPSAL